MTIWDDWKEHYWRLGLDARSICKDGIVNDKEFQRASFGVLFCAQETICTDLFA